MSATVSAPGCLTFGLEPRYMRERREGRKERDCEPGEPAPKPEPPAVEVTPAGILHSMDECTPELRHRVLEARSDLAEIASEVVRCLCCLLPLSLCRASGGLELLPRHVSEPP